MTATRVLVVDDSALNREVIHEILEQDYELIDAATATEAFQAPASATLTWCSWT